MVEFSLEIPFRQLTQICDESYQFKANDRRKLVNQLYDGWFIEQHMKLGRDYEIHIPQFNRYDYHKYNHSPAIITINIKNISKAILFKMTCL